MFKRFATILRKALPFSIGVATHLSYNPFVSLNTKSGVKSNESRRINIIQDISQYE